MVTTGPDAARYVVVCRGPNCRERGGRPLRARLAQLLRDNPTVQLIGYSCFGQCERGPNVAFYPEGAWYGGLSDPDAAELVVEHATVGAPPPGRALVLPADERRAHLRNIDELVATHEGDRQRRRQRRWWWPFKWPAR